MKGALGALLKVNPDVEYKGLMRQISAVKTSDWRQPIYDFEADSEAFLQAAQAREDQEAIKEENRIPVCRFGNFEKSYRVWYEDGNKKPWDCYMTKVDLKNGLYGDYVFYHMQLLEDTNRDLFVVFTRWGRIGEAGMNQRAPFGSIEEARKEFCTIFKQKTGGNDYNDLDNFTKAKKKYNLAHVNYAVVKYQDYMAPFDYKVCPKSHLDKPVQDLFEEIANVSMYKKALSQTGLDQEIMPINGLKKETIAEAKNILLLLTTVLEEDQELMK